MKPNNPSPRLRGYSGGARTTLTFAGILLLTGVLGATLILSMDVLRGSSTAGPWESGAVAPRSIYSDSQVNLTLLAGDKVALLEGQAIVRSGDIITDRQGEVLRLLEDRHPRKPWQVNVAGYFLLTLLLGLLLGLAVMSAERSMLNERANSILLLSLILGPLMVLKFIASFIEPSMRTWAMAGLNPVPSAVLLVAIFLRRDLALVVNLLLGIALLTIVGRNAALLTTTSLIAGTVAVHAASRQDSERSDVLRAGFEIGLVSALAILAFELVSSVQAVSPSFASVFGLCSFGLINGLVTLIVVLGSMPLFENGFNVTTTTKLQELLMPSHPLMQKLIREAPGTYHHSVNVAALAEAAAEEVGADPILAKAAAYYHDLGKTKRPYFFIENQMGGVNYHDNLSPGLSRLIIHSHTKDGVEICRKHNVPKCITDIMLEHHGTDLVAYFYHRARQGEDPQIEEVKEDTFRYSGPKPQTLEAAIVMMADGVEAASRTLKRPTPNSLDNLVQKIIDDHFKDGQFDECDITKRDLDLIQARISKTLSHMFHNRTSYPEGFQPTEDISMPPPPPDSSPANT